jgi:large subunit ribosomal protein L11
MGKQTINVMVEGGKATAGPPLGPALGPLGVNAGKVVAEINEKTKAFAGIKVPVKVIVDTSTKTFEIEVGKPPVAEMLKKEAGIEKGAGNKEEKAGNLKLEKVIEIAKAVEEKSMAIDLKSITKEVLGTCKSMGIEVDGKDPREIIKEIDEGKHDSLFA